jgi:hypothetical protein
MNAALAVEAIAQYLETELVNLRPDGDDGRERNISVYRYNLPNPAPAQMADASDTTPDSYEGMMPAVVVSPISWEDKALEDGSSVLTVSIMAGAFSRDPMNVEGSSAVLNMLERIRRLLLTHRIVGDAFEVVEPLNWQLYDEGYKPLWFGEMTTQWRILHPVRVDPEDWKGDFLREGDMI